MRSPATPRRFRFGVLFCMTLLALAPAGFADIVTPEQHRRGEDQTYLTYPEWFLVHSPAELAEHLSDGAPSTFPYFGHIGQFWEAYAAMTDAMAGRYALNVGYHVMVFVIGTSTTVEYAVKAGYEAVFGRWFEGGETAEDAFAAGVARDYVDFIRERPWYEYPFFARLRELWLETPLAGDRLLRKWERRYALTTEYLVKGIYAVLIGAATRTGYEAPTPVTAVVLDTLPDDRSALSELVELVPTEATGFEGQLVTVPRYAAFKDYARILSLGGATFAEIAGNRGVIVVSVLSPRQALVLAAPHRVLLEQPILTRPDRMRYVIETEVAALAPLLREVDASGLVLEHVYDY